jgi:hypothetical protein
MSESKSIAEMIGEMFREAAVLVTVFVPLDVVVAFYLTINWKDIVILVESTLIATAALGTTGILIERWRNRWERAHETGFCTRTWLDSVGLQSFDLHSSNRFPLRAPGARGARSTGRDEFQALFLRLNNLQLEFRPSSGRRREYR